MDNEILTLAENLTVDTVETVFKLIDKYVKNSPNKMDDIIEPFLPMAKNFVLGFVAKIDGQ